MNRAIITSWLSPKHSLLAQSPGAQMILGMV
ncbi:hypothetical protein FOMG_19884 [Fusarium oxysporum f. sp. melonis 26406]|uniref:Uncharacterized protein n=1 Tax=Fusarium oxysporum f. sp. melonis 26406 TaxID=1089452 RepID=W9YVX6_FUSOX|nr:hypothetical protein FOMG_19884 [Fusarium oxysporum f. sp. melonis 26406]